MYEIFSLVEIIFLSGVISFNRLGEWMERPFLNSFFFYMGCIGHASINLHLSVQYECFSSMYSRKENWEAVNETHTPSYTGQCQVAGQSSCSCPLTLPVSSFPTSLRQHVMFPAIYICVTLRAERGFHCSFNLCFLHYWRGNFSVISLHHNRCLSIFFLLFMFCLLL